MRPKTAKKPAKPKVDHDQGQNLLVKMLERIFSGRSNLVKTAKISKHVDSKQHQNSINFTRKIATKKKRQRKISYQSRRNNRLLNRKKIRI